MVEVYFPKKGATVGKDARLLALGLRGEEVGEDLPENLSLLKDVEKELKNAIKHLERSNQELRDEDPTDEVYIQAVEENEQALLRKHRRLCRVQQKILALSGAAEPPSACAAASSSSLSSDSGERGRRRGSSSNCSDARRTNEDGAAGSGAAADSETPCAEAGDPAAAATAGVSEEVPAAAAGRAGGESGPTRSLLANDLASRSSDVAGATAAGASASGATAAGEAFHAAAAAQLHPQQQQQGHQSEQQEGRSELSGEASACGREGPISLPENGLFL